MPETITPGPRFCSQCGRPVVVEQASFCKECGARLGGFALLGDLNTPAIIAFVLSVMPGLGHFYAGHTWRAIKWFIAVMFAYLIAPSLGLLIHLVCAVSGARAGMEDAERRGTTRAALSAGPRP